MAKKDFNAIAAIIKECLIYNRRKPTYIGLKAIKKLADYLQTTNKRFDRDKFIKACGF